LAEGFYTCLETFFINIKIRRVMRGCGLWVLAFSHSSQEKEKGRNFCSKEREVLGAGDSIHGDEVSFSNRFLQGGQCLRHQLRIVEGNEGLVLDI